MCKIIGLTGPMGAGKDTVVRILQKLGAEVINVDQLAHTLYVVHSPIWQKLVEAFGSKILNRGGTINRKKLGKIVFAEKKKLQLLNKIVHPALKEIVIREIESRKLSVESRKQQITIVNAALLKEIGLIDLVDEIWVVMASKANRLKRLIKKGMDRKTAVQRMKMQMGQNEYLKMADKIMKNDESVGKLKTRVVQFFLYDGQ